MVDGHAHRASRRQFGRKDAAARGQRRQNVGDGERVRGYALQRQPLARCSERLAQAREVDDLHRQRGRCCGVVQSETELHAELHLIGLRQEAVQAFAGETSEARIFEAESKRRRDVVAQADAVIHAIARPPAVD